MRLFVKNCTTNRQSSCYSCSFGEYAMSLDHSTGHDSFRSKEQNVSNKKRVVIIRTRDYKLFSSLVMEEYKRLCAKNG